MSSSRWNGGRQMAGAEKKGHVALLAIRRKKYAMLYLSNKG